MQHRITTQQAAFKVGVLTLAALLVFCGVVLWLRGRGISSGPDFSAVFTDVDGLREGGPVQLLGIRVGFIDSIDILAQPEGDYRVKVGFSLNTNDIAVPRGSLISIEQSGIIGEKFIEITPPQATTVEVAVPHPSQLPDLTAGDTLYVQYQNGVFPIGTIDTLLIQPRHETHDATTASVIFKAFETELPTWKNAQWVTLTSPDTGKPVWGLRPRKLITHSKQSPYFVVQNPMRLKTFLDIQLASAEALKETNDRINALLTDDMIATLNQTAENSELLTAKATTVLDSANQLFVTANRDIAQLMVTTDALAKDLTLVSHNINDVIGNADVKADLTQTINTLASVTESLNTLLSDPALKETLYATRTTVQQTAELSSSLNRLAQNEPFQRRLDDSLTLLNTSMTHLNSLLGQLDSASTTPNGELKALLSDTRETMTELKLFSTKLNKHFVLFRLMF